MSKRKVFHVVSKPETFSDRDWAVKQAGIDYPLARFPKKDEAVKYAVIAAKTQPLGQVKIHGKNGKIQSERTYGQDPEKYLS